MNEAQWQIIKSSYITGQGSLRQLATQYSVSKSTIMKRCRRERWTAARTLASRKVDAVVEATLEHRAAAFVNRTAEQIDRFLTRVSDSEAVLNPEDRQGLRQLASAFKDVVQVGRDTYQLGREDDQSRCLVNVAFLSDFRPEVAVDTT